MRKSKFFKVILICAVCVCSLAASVSIVSADDSVEIRNNIANMNGAVYSWSGIWGDASTDAEGSNTGVNAFDGAMSTKWGSANVAEGDQWISVTFPSAQKISGFKIWQTLEGWSNITGFTVQYKNGDGDWTDILQVEGDSDLPADTATAGGNMQGGNVWDTYEKTLDTAVTATAVRLYISANQVASPCAAAEISEFAIYNEIVVFDGGSGNTNVAVTETKEYAIDLNTVKVVASSESQAAQSSIDGNMDTKWGSVGNAVPQTLTILLPEDTDLAGFALYQDNHWSDVTAMTVDILVNGTWTTVHTMANDATLLSEYIVTLDTLWNTDAIRFNFTAVGDNCIRDNAITGNTATTSIDIKEVKLYVADSSNNNNNDDTGNPPTGDVMPVVLMASIVLACTALVAFKKKVGE